MSLDRRSLILSTALLLALPRRALAQATLEPLSIRTKSGTVHKFSVEVARTDAERAQGLMFRRNMPPDRGMIFDFERDDEVSMWMRNTFIPLEMLFIKADGIVHRIAMRTEPLSERTIPSGGPVRSVLELNGGICEKLGIAPGDLVEHRIFRR
jgi:hypothetical protein